MTLSNSFIAVKEISSTVPRSQFSEDELNDAAKLILKVGGVINPLILRQNSIQSYEVIDGHFEYYAAARAKEIDSQKGEYIGAFIIEPNNEDILQQQIALIRKKELVDKELTQKLEKLTTEIAQLAELVKKGDNEAIIQEQIRKRKLVDKELTQKLEKLTTEIAQLAESVKKIKNPIIPPDPDPDYEKMTVTKLKEKAKQEKIPRYSTMNRDKLIHALKNKEKS